jgi:type I restriction enzyme S subunit
MKRPKTWDWTTIESVAASHPNAISDGPFGSNLKLTDYVPQGVPVLQGKNITSDKFQWTDIRFISPQKAKELSRSKVSTGDILMVKIGSIGYSAIVPELHGHSFAIIPANLAKITPDPEKIYTPYLHHWLKSQFVKNHLTALASKTAQPALSLGKIKAVPVPLPPLPEQRRIAAILDHADALRAKRRAAIAKLDSLAQSIFLDMFGDPALNPKKWPMTSLGSMSLIFSDGPFGSNLKSEHYSETGVRVIRLQNIGVGKFLENDAAFVTEEHFAALARHTCRPGDVLIGTLGDPNLRACILPASVERALNKADCVQMRPDPKLANSAYVCALLNSRSTEKMARSLIQGQTRLRISMGRLRELNVPLPPLEIQNRFAQNLERVNNLLRLAEVSGSVLALLTDSAQHRAFQGTL